MGRRAFDGEVVASRSLPTPTKSSHTHPGHDTRVKVYNLYIRARDIDWEEELFIRKLAVELFGRTPPGGKKDGVGRSPEPQSQQARPGGVTSVHPQVLDDSKGEAERATAAGLNFAPYAQSPEPATVNVPGISADYRTPPIVPVMMY